ncbi:MAG: hypothetical protein K0S18_358 [Anaerocolumna sp.]|jgi:uncharacterized membrane protein|nr:hypothetical protein [Anaerocolumna sp.]
MKQIFKYLILFVIGGVNYYIIELLWRGYSHWTMAILGGICFILVGMLNEFYTWDMALVSQMFLSAIIITGMELIAGIILNIFLGLDIWDYGNLPYNFIGQVCLAYSNIWFLLSLPAILLDDYIRYRWLGEEKPHYKLF